MFRFDAPQQDVARPHTANIVPAAVVRRLMADLSDRNVSLTDIVERIERYPALARRILQLANSSLAGARSEISQPLHAMSMLGSRRLLELIAHLPADAAGDRHVTDGPSSLKASA